MRDSINEVLPYTGDAVQLHLFGPHSEFAAPEHPVIVKHGVIESFGEVVDRCSLLVCPEGSGEGVRVKLAEAVYNRMPVLATSQAARGLPATTLGEPGVVIRDSPREWTEFLRSGLARRIAASEVSEQTASEYSIDRHRTKVQQYV